MPVHPTARLDPLSRVHPSASVGPHARVEAGVDVREGARIGERTILRPGTMIARDAQVGRECDLENAQVYTRGKVGDHVRMHEHSSVGHDAEVGSNSTIKHCSSVYHDASVGDGARLGAWTKVEAGTRAGKHLRAEDEVTIAAAVEIGDNCHLQEGARLAPHAQVGNGTRMGRNARIGDDIGVGVTPPTTIGNDCVLGDDTQVHTDAGMGDGCRLDTGAVLEFGARMEPGSTVGAGSRVQPKGIIAAGTAVPPSTLVRADGTQVPRYTDIDDYDWSKNDEQDLAAGSSSEHNRTGKNPPPERHPAGDKAWIVTDINGEPYPEDGYFSSEKECREHISANIDSAEDRLYDRDSMFEPTALERAPGDTDSDSPEIWIVKSDRFLAPEHGFFQSRPDAAKDRKPYETIAKVQPARQRQQDRTAGRDDKARQLPETPPPAPPPAAEAALRASQRRHEGPAR